jgi:hypothetical protein
MPHGQRQARDRPVVGMDKGAGWLTGMWAWHSSGMKEPDRWGLPEDLDEF